MTIAVTEVPLCGRSCCFNDAVARYSRHGGGKGRYVCGDHGVQVLWEMQQEAGSSGRGIKIERVERKNHEQSSRLGAPDTRAT